MNKKVFNGSFVPKGDIEANWNKAVGFIPLNKEIIIYKKDETHPVARFKVGDGKTVVQELPFAGADMAAIEKLIDEKGKLLIEYVDNAVAAINISTLLVASSQIIGAGQDSYTQTPYIRFSPTPEQEVSLINENITTIKLDLTQLGNQVPAPYVWVKRNTNVSVAGIDAIQFTAGGEQFYYDNYATDIVIKDIGNAALVYVPSLHICDISFASISIPDLYYKLGLIPNNVKDENGGAKVIGDLAVTGNLEVAGTTTTKDTETVMVKDNTIVANSDGLELLEEAGFVVKTNATDAYGIMYDPNGDGVKIGLGSFDEAGKFNYTEGEDQFLATRADTIVDGHTVVWDDDTKQLVDSGVDHSEYVKFKDYASATKAGVVKVATKEGTQMQGDTLSVVPASKWAIDNRKTYNSHEVISPSSNLDYATMSSLADCKQPELWTDDKTENGEVVKGTKTKACETIGATPKPLDSWSMAYGGGKIAVLVNGEWKKMTISGAGAYNIAMRQENGVLNVGTPTADNHATNKKYVDDGFVAKQNPEFDSGATRGYVYFIDTDGNQVVRKAQIQAVENGTIPIRDPFYNFYVGEPKYAPHCANKGYVDGKFVAKDTVSSNGVYGKSGGAEILYSISQWGYGGGEDSVARRTNKGGLRVVLDETNAKPEEMATPRGYVDGKIDALSQDISVINLTLEQSGLLKKYKQPIEQEYNERVTADGANVLDGSKAVLKKIVGNTVACKNLFDVNSIVYTSNLATNANEKLIFDNSSAQTPTYISTESVTAIKLKPNTTYTSRCKIKATFVNSGGGSGGSMSHGLVLQKTKNWDEGETFHIFGDKLGINEDNKEAIIYSKFTTPADLTGYNYLVTRPSGYVITEFSELMLVEGDYTESNFPEYQSYFTGLKSASFAGVESGGRNLFNTDRTEQNLGALVNTTPRVFEENKYFVGLTSNNYYYRSNVSDILYNNGEFSFRATNPVNAAYGVGFAFFANEGEQYALSYTGENATASVSFYKADGTYVSSVKTNTFTIPTGCNTFVVVFNPTDGNAVISVKNIQIEKGTTATEYTPHISPYLYAFPKTETPLGTTIDFEKKKITDYGVELVLTGTETWGWYGYQNTRNGAIMNILKDDDYPAYNATVKGVSTDSENVGAISLISAVKNGFWVNTPNNFIWNDILDNLGFTTAGAYATDEEKTTAIASFKAYLAQRYADGNPVTIRYVSSVLQSESTFTEGNEYTAYKGGTEKVLENDGNKYGADNTLTQDYILVTEVK